MDTIRQSRSPKTARYPDKPGVYLMKDAAGDIIYIGKASSLKKRVSSYYRKSGIDIKTSMLVRQIADIDYIVTDSEVEALILESTLIKKHTPKFNIRLKDDKRYPYIAITLGEAYPRVVFTRKVSRDGNRYFGPYTDAGAARKIISMINRTFKLKTCNKTLPLKSGERPCLNYQMNRCSGVCTGKITRDEYLLIADTAVRFLEGDTDPVIRDLEAMMAKFADSMEYEKAAGIRDIIGDIHTISREQKVFAPVGRDQDLIDIATGGGEALLLLFEYRAGQLIGKKIFVFDHIDYATHREIVQGFLVDYYNRPAQSNSAAPGIPSRIVIPCDIEDRAAINLYLRERSARKVTVGTPKGPEERGIMNMVRKNLDLIMAERSVERIKRDTEEGLLQLQQLLGLKRKPVAMECFDISNTGGKQSVAAMVRFTDGKPDKKNYRRYRIRSYDEPNDPGMIHEAVGRRIQFLLNEGKELPDIIVVDGGKGQLSRALEIKTAFRLETVFISLAKKFEEIHYNPTREPLRLPEGSPALRIIQQLRDEAHRFAVSYHRSLRDKKTAGSILDGIPGISTRKKQVLLKHLKEPSRVRELPAEELEMIPGIGAQTAALIYSYFHRQPGEGDG